VHHFRAPHLSGSSRLLRIVGIATVIAIAFGAGSIFTAMGTPAPVTYSACLAATNSRLPSYLGGILPNGTLYNVTINSTPRCQQGDTLVTWNQQGPIGPTGPTGQTGKTGPSGPSGVVRDCSISNVYPGINLAECAMPGADLANSDLTGADLASTDLTSADLTYANLTGANLTDANLTDANLTFANLTGANLTGANLTDANLTAADLDGLIFTNVFWSNTTCPDGTNSDSDGNTCTGHF